MLFADISLSTLALIRYPSTGPSLKPLSTDWTCKLAAVEPAPERLSRADQAIKESQRASDRPHLPRFVPPAGTVPREVWLESESLARDIVRPAQSKDRRCRPGDAS